MPTLSTAGPIALAKNRPCELRIPVAIAARPTRSRYGNMIRVRVTASDAWAGSFMKPGAIASRM
jgi:hypothetical protein